MSTNPAMSEGPSKWHQGLTSPATAAAWWLKYTQGPHRFTPINFNLVAPGGAAVNGGEVRRALATLAAVPTTLALDVPATVAGALTALLVGIVGPPESTSYQGGGSAARSVRCSVRTASCSAPAPRLPDSTHPSALALLSTGKEQHLLVWLGLELFSWASGIVNGGVITQVMKMQSMDRAPTFSNPPRLLVETVRPNNVHDQEEIVGDFAKCLKIVDEWRDACCRCTR